VAKERSIPNADAQRITPQSFGLLLAALGDHATDGSHYERLRAKLIFFFTRRLLAFPEDLADEVLDRLVQRLSQGTEIQSVDAFALGIARHVAQEQRGRKVQVQGVDPGFFDNIPTPPATLNNEEEIVRMERCLKKLSRSESRLLRSYYLAAGRNLMDARKKLSETLGLSSIALRQRVFLARQRLRDCMTADAAKEKR
jgi:DNA-directed RNA polymerase specialized sigma24 family protein